MENVNSAESLREALRQFYGSDTLYRSPLNRSVVYTEGVKHFADAVGGYWLLDILATEPAILKEAREFADVRLVVKDDRTAQLTVTDGGKGADPVVVYERHLNFTDCPVGEWQFFFENFTLMLPSER